MHFSFCCPLFFHWHTMSTSPIKYQHISHVLPTHTDLHHVDTLPPRPPLSRPAMPSPIDFGVSGDLPNELKPNFARMCASHSSTIFQKLMGRRGLKHAGSAS